MIEINLLPPELKKKKKAFKIPDITLIFMPLAIGIISILVAVQILLWVGIIVKERAYGRLDKKWTEILPQKREIDEIKKKIKIVQLKVKAIDDLMVKRVLWSRKLNELSDSMIPGIWLTKLSLEEKKQLVSTKSRKAAMDSKTPEADMQLTRFLNIEGSASSAFGDETATVGRFIQSLKDNKGFFKDFSQIELEMIHRKTIKDIEVMNFRIICYFKDVGERG